MYSGCIGPEMRMTLGITEVLPWHLQRHARQRPPGLPAGFSLPAREKILLWRV